MPQENEFAPSASDEVAEGTVDEKQELSLEKHLIKLIRSCKMDNHASCSTILKIMLMNSAK
jgi:hypothetical protein